MRAPGIYVVSGAHQDIDVLCCANFNARHPGALDAAQFLLLGWLLPGKTLPHDLHRALLAEVAGGRTVLFAML